MADLNRDKNMGSGNKGDQGGQQPGQHAPGRDPNEDISTGGRQGGTRGTNREGFQGDLDREDREREQPGSKQVDQNR